MRQLPRKLLVAGVLFAATWKLCAQDIVINSFESSTYSAWTTTGTAFGSGPALGTLTGQNPVTGYQGSRLVNTFLGGDASTGTLTSPSFSIQRNYIRFLIGGGNQRGKTCMNLIENGQVVRSSVGMGDREDLSALQWNVSDLINSNATLQIVDTATGGWGHINVDQIVQTDTSLGSVVTITNRYLCLPVKTGATRRLFELVVDGLVTHEFFIELADTVTPDFYSFLDLTNFQGKQALVRVDSAPATTTNLNSLVWSNGIVGANTFYQEANRPIYHVTARRGWLNDPNGLVFFNGEYHLGFQHNPYGWNWANMHWEHEVSTDLVHWTELPEWLYPDPLGAMWSGSAIVDWNNSAGFGTNALIAFYTGAAKGSDPNLPRMANAGQFTQCMAYSLDSGRTWTKYTNNPVVPNLVGGDNRDPKVFWYAPGNKWVMVLWLNNNDYGIFSSTNLKNWMQSSTFTFPGVMEVPDMFQLPLDGNAVIQKWIFWGGAGSYYLGTFDGNSFTAQSGPFTLRGGDCFAATQTYNNIPGDARRILIVHGTAQFPGMPFNNNINFPMDLTLRTSPAGARLYANPVTELALLRTSTNTWPTQSLVAGNNVMAGTYGEAFDLDATFHPGTATSVIFNLRGTTVTYNCTAQTITCNSTTQALAPSNGVVRLQILVDRGTVEIFGNGGLLYMPMRVTPSPGFQAVSLAAIGSGATLNSLTMHNLGSAFNYVSNSTPDLLLSDFEQTNYAWLPGGVWTATGTAFGSGPAQGTLAGQNPVDGYFGNGLVNTFLSGDTSTGTLTSPAFTIQRKYLRFLIGGGNLRGQTCMNLLVNGQVVRSTVGMGDREHLDWLQWNVSAYSNQTAQIQIVDAATGGWGHINVDEIMQTDVSLPGVITASQPYLNLPIRTGAPKHLVELVQDGLVVREMNVELADTATNFWAFMDLTPFAGQELIARVDSQFATTNQLATYFVQTNTIITDTPIYQEALRPIYHYTTRRGWVNDANGMLYFNGEYHFSYQHNPYGWAWDNMHWGNAVSTNLVNWTELPEALYPDNFGTEFSGSALVDWNNSAGFGTNTLIAFFCAAGGQNRMSIGKPSTQCMAYSLDQGRTWLKYTNNPIVPNLADGNRDPKVIWYAPGNKWVMVLYLINNDFAILSSNDLKHWTQTSTFTFPGAFECPELFALPVDGNTNNVKWVFYTNVGHYYVGVFDGNTFAPQFGPFSIRGANNFWAGQTFNNMPASDTRRILMANGSQDYPGMPFNQPITFPVELTLVTTAGTPMMYVNPVREVALLRTSTNTWPAQTLTNGVNVMTGMTGEACELDALIQPGSASQITFTLRGTTVVYDNVAHQVTCAGISQPLTPTNGTVHLRMLVDRGILEIFANDGLLYMPANVTPMAGALPLSLVANGSGAQLVSLKLYNLGSMWGNSSTGIPVIITPPATTTANLGGPATFSVTASGVGPLFYQWRSNGQPIAGATNSTLSFFPVTTTSTNFDVVISNASGAVTSSVVALTIRAPYKIGFWRMESQVVTPNTAGTPTYNGVSDASIGAGQGIFSVGVLSAAEDDLITFNGLSGGPVVLSNSVPPATMFVNGNNGGAKSYNAAAIAAVDGALFFPQDLYGNEFSFNSPFSIELFFRTHGNQSGAGPMELVMQGENNFRFGIIMNEAGAGSVRFALNNVGTIQRADLGGANYADGQWHYLRAVYDTLSTANGQLRLTVVNQDGTEAAATNSLPAGFGPLAAGNDGNLFLGRNTYLHAQDPRTFLGLIDEVQISAGVVSDSWRVGKVPSTDNHPRLGGISLGTNNFSFQWSGAASNNFIMQWVGRLGDAWQNIATLPSANGLGTYMDTNAGRLSGAAGFYRILSQ